MVNKKVLLVLIVALLNASLTDAQFGFRKKKNKEVEACGIEYVDEFYSASKLIKKRAVNVHSYIESLKERLKEIEKDEPAGLQDSAKVILSKMKSKKNDLILLKGQIVDLYNYSKTIKKKLNIADATKAIEGTEVVVVSIKELSVSLKKTVKSFRISMKIIKSVSDIAGEDAVAAINQTDFKFSAISVILQEEERPDMIDVAVIDEYVNSSFDIYQEVVSISVKASSISEKVLQMQQVDPMTVKQDAKEIVDDLIDLGRTIWSIKTHAEKLVALGKSMPSRARKVGIRKARVALKNIAVSTKMVALAAKEVPNQIINLYNVAEFTVKEFNLNLTLSMDMFKKVNPYVTFAEAPEAIGVSQIDEPVAAIYSIYHKTYDIYKKTDSLKAVKEEITIAKPDHLQSYVDSIKPYLENNLTFLKTNQNSLSDLFKDMKDIKKDGSIAQLKDSETLLMVTKAVGIAAASLRKVKALQKRMDGLLETEVDPPEDRIATILSREPQNATAGQKVAEENSEPETALADEGQAGASEEKVAEENAEPAPALADEGQTGASEEKVAEENAEPESALADEGQAVASEEKVAEENAEPAPALADEGQAEASEEKVAEENIYSAAQMNLMKFLKRKEEFVFEESAQLKQFKLPPNAFDIAINIETDLLAILDEENNITIHNLLDNKQLYKIDNIEEPKSLTFSPDGKFLAYSSGRRVKILDIKTFKIIEDIRGRFDYVSKILYSPKGRYIACMYVRERNYKTQINLYTTERYRKEMALRNELSGVSMSFSEDENFFLSSTLYHIERGNEYNEEEYTNGEILTKSGKQVYYLNDSAEVEFFGSITLAPSQTYKLADETLFGAKVYEQENKVVAFVDDQVGVWLPDNKKYQCFYTHQKDVVNALLIPEREQLLSYTSDEIIFWNNNEEDINYYLARQSNTLKGYQAYKKKFSNGKYTKTVDSLVDKINYQTASNEHSIKAYQNYLKITPEPLFKEFALLNIEKIDFNKAVKSNTIQAFQSYLKKYPEGRYIAESQGHIERLYFENAQNSNHIADYFNYLKLYPKGKYVSRVNDGIEKSYYKLALNDSSIAGYELYLYKYAQGQYAAEIEEELENSYYDIAKKGENIILYNQYLNRYPTGTYADSAKQQMKELVKTNEKAAFDFIMNGTIKDCEEYFEVYPNGKYKKQAKVRMDYLQIQNSGFHIDIEAKEDLYTVETFGQNIYKQEFNKEKFNSFIEDIKQGNIYKAEKYIMENNMLDNRKKKQYSLPIAIQEKQYSIVEMLITHGASLNYTDENSQNAAMLLAQRGDKHINLVDSILDRQINPNQRNKYGQTTLDVLLNNEVIDNDRLSKLSNSGVSPSYYEIDSIAANTFGICLVKDFAVDTIAQVGSLLENNDSLKYNNTWYSVKDLYAGLENQKHQNLIDSIQDKTFLPPNKQTALADTLKKIVLGLTDSTYTTGAKQFANRNYKLVPDPVYKIKFSNDSIYYPVYTVIDNDGLYNMYFWIPGDLEINDFNLQQGYAVLNKNGDITHLSTNFKEALHLLTEGEE